MTKEDALQIVISIARQWGENLEKGLPGGRIHPDDSDDDLRDVHGRDWQEAVTVRDLWRAIDILQQGS